MYLVCYLYCTTNSDGLFYSAESLKTIYIFFSELSMAVHGLPCKGKKLSTWKQEENVLTFYFWGFFTHRVNKGSWIITEKDEEIL